MTASASLPTLEKTEKRARLNHPRATKKKGEDQTSPFAYGGKRDTRVLTSISRAWKGDRDRARTNSPDREGKEKGSRFQGPRERR